MGDVVSLADRKARPERSVRRRRTTRPFCAHLHVGVSVRDRELVCVDCGCNVDPFAWIDRVAREDEWVVELIRKHAQLAEEVEELTRRAANLRRQVRRGETGNTG